MRVQVRKLRDTMGLLQPLVPKKPTYAILANILLKDGKAMAKSMETTVMIDLPEASEAMVLPVSLIDFLSYVPGDSIAEICRDGNGNNVVTCGGSKRNFPYIDPKEFPAMPETPTLDLHADGDGLLEALTMARVYASKDDDRPVLTGVTLSLGPEKSYVAAGDGYQMFHKEIPCTGEPLILVIRESAIHLLRDLWKKTARADTPVADALLAEIAIARRIVQMGVVERDDTKMLFARFGNVTFATRLIGGSPPDWLSLVPTGHKTILKLFAQDLYRTILQVANVAAEAGGAVRLAWADNVLAVSAITDEQTVEARTIVSIEGENGHIAFNCAYLLNYLKTVQGMVDVRIIAQDSPATFLDGKCTVVIMPMFIKWENDPADETEADDIQDTTSADDTKDPVTEKEPPVAAAAAKPARKSRKKVKV